MSGFNAGMPAYPVAEAQRDGLTKRELIASMAMHTIRRQVEARNRIDRAHELGVALEKAA